MTTVSLDKLEYDGIINGNATSWSYNAVSNDSYGNGLRNNHNEPGLFAIDKYVGYNDGFLKRQRKTSFNYDKYNGLRSETHLKTELKEYSKCSKSVLVENGKGYQVWYQNAIIKLYNVSSFFSFMPLVKGFSAKVILNLNLSSLKLTICNKRFSNRSKRSIIHVT
jgi:hypothetical protein